MAINQERHSSETDKRPVEVEEFDGNPDEKKNQQETPLDHLEKAEELHDKETAKREALEQASDLAEKSDEKRSKEPTTDESVEPKLRGAPSRKQLKSSFQAQMHQIQGEFSFPQKIASKFFHLQPIETASDFIGSTVARPNTLLSGSVAAFIAVVISFFIGKYYGYRLSGFETIAAFVLGWVLGIAYDYVVELFRRDKE